ncbi:UDP-glucuronosyltransferase 2B9-like [Agrilus planipennis]|uniref:UDP-glucuronosyltransferase 2B9-like n=1 Tax=Agrilus planipennis TaxID=224129 RepID=A0A1W4XFW8_AGRPL|nr:UDP-glucuronosyltransferase 2B9-like [Agrilus planipennis]
MSSVVQFGLLIIILSGSVKSANILGFFPIAAVSHQKFFQPIWRELSLRGHNVTVYTPNPLQNSSLVNLTEIDLSDLYDYMGKGQIKEVMRGSTSPYQAFHVIYETLVMPLLEVFENHVEIQKFLRDNTSQYDVVLVEPFPLVFLALGSKFNCPVISVVSLNPFTPIHESVGNVIHPVFYPDVPLSYVHDLNFFERLYNTFQTLKIMIYHEYNLLARCDEYIKKNIGENIPPIREISRNISALFLSLNPIFNIVRPLSPLTIPMSFMHVQPPKELPQTKQQRTLISRTFL